MPLPAGTKVVVYSKTQPRCPYCEEAKQWLKDHAVAFDEIRLEEQSERDALYDSLGLVGPRRSVPQIMVVDNVLGTAVFPIGDCQALKISGIA